MEFWGAEVKVGEVVKVDPSEFEACIHLSQAALGEAKKDKGSEPVFLNLKVGDQKLVLGTLSREKIPQISLELVLDKEFELSHNSKNASVYFCGYKTFYAGDESEEDDFTDSDEDLPLTITENGKPETKAEDLKVSESKKPNAKISASAKQVKVIDPKKEEESDDESDEDDEFGSSDDEMEDADSGSGEESESDEDDDEETPAKKVDLGKKRPNDSALKTPVSTKKAKNATPEKTDGKKTVRTATPHPMKKGGKTPNSEAKVQTPKSGGQISCKSCSKSFNSESGLQQHNKAKHGAE
ncbi:histone deacetylase HDT1-like [Gastrolobium bilobum]|uniref:histone deacetylase HDT1-like n=1 Tax=Gastrolobium bilobum TaxID=150636 RepID=UPI002AAFA475|nr:histone deacetylase HDT1-like [Gastrolobium bilobum]